MNGWWSSSQGYQQEPLTLGTLCRILLSSRGPWGRAVALEGDGILLLVWLARLARGAAAASPARCRRRRRQPGLLAPGLAAGPGRGVASRKRAEKRSSGVSPWPRRPRALRAARLRPGGPLVPSIPAPPGSGKRAQGRRDRRSPGRGAHLPDERRRWRRAPSAPGSGPALRSARPEGRDRRGGRVPAPFNFGGGAGWRPASGTVGIPLSARGVAETALLATVSQRASSLTPIDAA